MKNIISAGFLISSFCLLAAMGCSTSGQKKLGKALDTAAEIATGDCGQKVAAAALACAKHIPAK